MPMIGTTLHPDPYSEIAGFVVDRTESVPLDPCPLREAAYRLGPYVFEPTKPLFPVEIL